MKIFKTWVKEPPAKARSREGRKDSNYSNIQHPTSKIPNLFPLRRSKQSTDSADFHRFLPDWISSHLRNLQIPTSASSARHSEVSASIQNSKFKIYNPFSLAISFGRRLSAFSTAAALSTAFLVAPIKLQAQLSITQANSTITQNFDTLANSGSTSAQTGGIFDLGWSFLESGADTTYRTGTGSASTGDTYSFGSSSSSDRAFGMLQGGSFSSILGFKFTNNTGLTITSLDVGYTGETWRLNTSGADSLAFSHQSGSQTLNAASGWTTVAGLAFTTPTGSTGPVDGNNATYRTVISPVTISGLTIGNGTTYTLRWVDGSGSNSAGMGIDDFSIKLYGAPAGTFWTGTGSAGTWQNGNSGLFGASYANDLANTVIFDGTASTVTASGTPQAGSITFNVAGYTIDGALQLGLGTITAPSGTTTISANISGNGSSGLTKAGAGELVLSGANTYTGTTTITTGTLTTSASNVINDSSAVSVASGAAFNLGGTDIVGSISGAGNYSLGSNTLTVGGDNTSTTVSGVISGTGGLTKAGTGTLTLSGVNTYNGTTTINAGTLALGGSGITINGSVTIAGGELNYANASNNQITSSANLTITSGNLTLGARSQTINALNMSGGRISIAGGTITLSAASSITGGNLTFTAAGGGISTSGMTTLGNAVFNYDNTGTNSSNGFAMGGDIAVNASTTTTFSNNSTGSGRISLNGANRNFDVGLGASMTVGWFIAGNAGNGITKNGAGTLILAGANTYTGATTINAGTLQIGNGGATGSISTSSAITVNGTLAFNRSGDIVQGTNFSTAAISGTGSLIQNGSGNLTLNAANTYTGGATLNSGTLNINNSGSGGTSSAIGTGRLTINGGTLNNTSGSTITLSTNNAQSWNGDFAFTGTNDLNLGTGAVTLNATRTITVNSGNLTVGGPISGTGYGLTKNGSGTLILSGSNSFSGNTTINAGTLQASVTGALANTSIVNLNGGSLLVAATDAINDSTEIRMGGGKLGLSGSGISETIGAMTLTANSVIDLYALSGVSTLRFGDSSSKVWTAGATLQIWNWDGTNQYGTSYGSGNRRIYFGSNGGNGLTTSQLSQISFYSDNGTSFIGSGFIDSSSMVGAVPEPQTIVVAILILAGIVYRLVKQNQRPKED